MFYYFWQFHVLKPLASTCFIPFGPFCIKTLGLHMYYFLWPEVVFFPSAPSCIISFGPELYFSRLFYSPALFGASLYKQALLKGPLFGTGC